MQHPQPPSVARLGPTKGREYALDCLGVLCCRCVIGVQTAGDYADQVKTFFGDGKDFAVEFCEIRKLGRDFLQVGAKSFGHGTKFGR